MSGQDVSPASSSTIVNEPQNAAAELDPIEVNHEEGEREDVVTSEQLKESNEPRKRSAEMSIESVDAKRRCNDTPDSPSLRKNIGVEQTPLYDEQSADVEAFADHVSEARDAVDHKHGDEQEVEQPAVPEEAPVQADLPESELTSEEHFTPESSVNKVDTEEVEPIVDEIDVQNKQIQHLEREREPVEGEEKGEGKVNDTEIQETPNTNKQIEREEPQIQHELDESDDEEEGRKPIPIREDSDDENE